MTLSVGRMIDQFNTQHISPRMILDYGKYEMKTTERLALTFPKGTTVYDTDINQWFAGDGVVKGGKSTAMKLGRTGSNSISGFMVSTNNVGYQDRTYQTIMSVPAHVSQIRLVYRNLSPNAVVISSSGCASDANLVDTTTD